MRKVKFVIIALMVGLFSGTMLFVSCQKEGVSPSSMDGSNAVVENSAKSSGSAWTYGDPAYYDEFGLPRWSESYPRIIIEKIIKNGEDVTNQIFEDLRSGKMINDTSLKVVVNYYYTNNDYGVIMRQNVEEARPHGKGTDCMHLKNCKDTEGVGCEYPCRTSENAPCDCLPIVEMPSVPTGFYKSISSTGSILNAKVYIKIRSL